MFNLLSLAAALHVTSALAASINFARQGSTSTSAAPLHPNGVMGKCVAVKGNAMQDSTPVEINDCDGSQYQNWVISNGSTKIQLVGTNFCLDASSNPGNNVGMTIATCNGNSSSQQWYYTDDKRISLEGKGQCLDLTYGSLQDGNQLQTYQCTDNNINQIWTTASAGSEQPSTTSASPLSTASSLSSTSA